MISYEQEMTRDSKFKYLVATVAPSNIPSKKSFLNVGYKEDKKGYKDNECKGRMEKRLHE